MHRGPRSIYAVVVQGQGHLPFLLPHLHSVRLADPHAEHLVLHSGDDPREIALLSRVVPRARFEPIPPAEGPTAHHRIGEKMHAWAIAARRAHERFPDQPLVLIDADTIVRAPVAAGLPAGCDIAYTTKTAGFPINTGVLIARTPARAIPLLDHLARRARLITADPALLEDAKLRSGAADQHALRELIGFDTPAAPHAVSLPTTTLRLAPIPCAQFNQTDCVPLTTDLRVVHYKAGWHPILLHGSPFTQARPADRCAPLLALWRDTLRAASRHLASTLVTDACTRHARHFARTLHDLQHDSGEPFRERGVLHSEMLAACATIADLAPELVIESGRYRGQSTLVLARWLRGRGCRLLSFERFRDDNAPFAERAVDGCEQVELRYADAVHAIPAAVERHAHQRMALFLDGPKAGIATDLADRAFRAAPALMLACVHDTRRGTPERQALDDDPFRRAFFTDDPAFVEAHRHLDESCISPRAAAGDPGPHDWTPYHRGTVRRESYGPTLALLFPEPARHLGTRQQRNAKPSPHALLQQD